ncbi:MAG: hypothetical protein ACMUIP_08340 [bacterium]
MKIETIPSRPEDAITGSEFAFRTARMTGPERQRAALDELRKGNIPDFLRNLKSVRLSFKPVGGKERSATIWVMPDYLAIGSDEDFLRIPLTYLSAIAIAEQFGFILPTRKMVDAIYKQATCHLKPEPLPPGPNMRSSEYYLKHQEMIRSQRESAGCSLGELMAGHKKDVVISNRLNKKPGSVAIYGWHRKDGKPIQSLSTVHGERYADYSHGIRFVYRMTWIDGEPQSIIDVLQDPSFAPIFTYEGVLHKLLKLLGLKK